MIALKFKKFNIEAYKPGKSRIKKFKNVIKLSANESALGFSPKVKKLMLNKNLISSKYPDGKASNLRKAISKTYKCNSEKIICGAGSDEVIQMICQLFLSPKDEVVLPEYSFLMYRIYSKIVGAKVVFAKEIDFKISIDEILKKISKKTKIVFIANPNNPTGTYLTKKEVLKLRKKLNKNILLVIDDAYSEYMKNSDYASGLNLFKNNDNVFILRTFSKIFGLAALRVGWGYGSKKIIKALNMIKPPFNVNQIAQLAAVESLKDKKFIKKSINHNLFYAKKIKKFLENYSIFSNTVSANFLMLDFEKSNYSASFFYQKLKQKGIILRSTENGYHIKNKLRLTIGSSKENLKFMNVVKGILN
ncbi:histidinol-phosphate transaminase [Candidatus Pelagibacter communis]|uniref:histidinol-phosphate transaminase n=1 Tax=Pelagibacter ubique TaxID=198252 RepID=UPI00094D4B3F|nr:histidinol-phosphate transaminase [Candidatus Pelagibacter ubique]|tara:strand:- start:49 stop:1131 length:1083 start_codon:yes stop_codon:yes gene_type:complete